MALPLDLATLTLTQVAELLAERRLPPVDSWNPAHCGDSDMRIAADGRWFHQGAPITRPEMVTLFASILRREADGRYVLVTPTERLSIEVEDLPFVATELKSEGRGPARRLGFRLNTGELLVATTEHPILIEDGPGGQRPALLVRGALRARIARPVYYQLAEMALEEDGAGLWSDGAYFRLGDA